MKKTMPILPLLSFLALAACGTKNTDRQAPPETFTSLTIEAAQSKTLADPKVNILFVVDNSGSMKNYQEKLAKNIALFSTHFFKNSRIDYRIGVVPVYDSKYLDDKTVYRSGLRKMNALGELAHLKGTAPEDTKSRLYITRDTINPQEVLQQTVLIGVQWGPEAEESFSPVLVVMDEKRNAELNEGFIQQEATLAVIFLTDADDVTLGLSGEDFYQRLIQLKGGDRSKVVLAAALPNIFNQSSECSKDGRGPVQALPSLIAASGAILADLCSDDFGAKLADFGKYLVQRVAAQKIALNFTPDIHSLQVSYGSKDGPEAERIPLEKGVNGYFFNSSTNEVVLSPSLKIPRKENGVIFVQAVPVSLGNYKSGRLKQI